MYFFKELEEPMVNKPNSTNLEYIKIIGLFGRHDVELHFDNEVNVYIGENGLGKTTILNCVYYILKQRFVKLAEIEFSDICVKFKTEEEYRISIFDINAYNNRRMKRRSYNDDEYFKFIIHDIIGKPFDLNSINEDEFEMAIIKVAHATGISKQMARRQIMQYLKTGDRFYDKNHKEGSYKKVEDLCSAIDKNILQNILYLTTYRRIENDFSNLFNKDGNFGDGDILIKFGMADVEKLIDSTLELIRNNSIESFNKMTGVLLKQYAQPKTHTEYGSLDQSIDKDMLKIILDRLGNKITLEDKSNIISLLDERKIFDAEYSYLFDLIVKLIENYDKQKIYDDKIKKFVNTCNKYLNGKQFVYNQSDLKLEIRLQENDKNKFNSSNYEKLYLLEQYEQAYQLERDAREFDNIKLTNLSSGEKQIVSLFSRLYLDNDKDCIIIIDEPELSLSMKWQKMLLPDVMRSCNCKLLLTVTHSPFIFDNEFDLDAKEMRNCISNHSGGR